MSPQARENQRAPHSPTPSEISARAWTRTLRNKVPEITLLFWVVTILSTSVGETAADYLNRTLGLGLPATTAVMGVLLAAVLIGQFAVRRYVPSAYWSSVVLISVVGTLLPENLVDGLGMSLWASTALFAACLVTSLTAWYRTEPTLSIHSILTRRREAFYWWTILSSFALGASAGELMSKRLALGYGAEALIFGGLLAIIAVAHLGLGSGAVVAFWSAYVLTRPFGASLGALLTTRHRVGGLGLGENRAGLLFLLVIVAAVGWFTAREHRAPSTARDRYVPAA